MSDDSDYLASQVARDIETGITPSQDPVLNDEYQTFIDGHTNDTNVTLARTIADRLEADGFQTEASAWRTQASMLELLSTFQYEGADDETEPVGAVVL